MTKPGPAGFQLAYLRIERRHTNPAGSAHGGLLMTMMDLTLARSAGRYLGHDHVVATVQLSCNLISTAHEGEEVYGEAQVERATRLLTFASARLRAGERTLMTATGVFRNPPEKGAVSV